MVKKKQQQKQLPLFIILIIVIFLSIFFIVYFQKNINTKVSQQQMPVSLPTISTTNWISFASTQHTFSIKAPSTFTNDTQGVDDRIFLEQQLYPVTHKPITPLSSVAAGYMTNNQGINESCTTDADRYNLLLASAKGAIEASHGIDKYEIFPVIILGKTSKAIAMLTPGDINNAEKTNIPAYVDEYVTICQNKKQFEFQFVINGNLDVTRQEQPVINSILSSLTFIN